MMGSSNVYRGGERIQERDKNGLEEECLKVVRRLRDERGR